MNSPVLIACAHGTRNAEGQAAIRKVMADIEDLRPGLQVLEAYVDVQEPELSGVVEGLPEGTAAVVVPLLLSTGFHIKVDVPKAIKSRPEVVAARPLGPDPRLAELLAKHLRAAGLQDRDGVLLAAAGSSLPDGSVDSEEQARLLAELLPNKVRVAYGASAEPNVPDGVASLRAELSQDGGRVFIASYLLATGYFHDQLFKAGADVVTAPLLPSPVLAEIALERYDAVLAGR
ncbi:MULTISPECIES: sirohydrochlorin chelatase [Paenarthrobacter]|uniref:Sirohydrochlorin chelatase n=1 Tax=Paenarthrobacter ureafaciens TaxID=37931 RepID=A0AAX3EFK1_PAEUR|nr:MULTISPECIES: sirohydrochlorin chelatase [Paenarthrobacter]NKR10213.1 cobalamin biosynthesis protein CbiX [Arthrobacter sp. M5]NKR14484.1 cobalamin biosynthesis protein CbiX [Arthrobacter sp. M6]OEH60357.1 cobalamin biosynthesis protein CbiX [Arthrobacter sp. D4]OEH60972.1 cobalamin biosynthesis protein CbiX [Arthrobacter sp. D2]MDO5865819.1 sirohydrochlorin chelatase [Paenarthrobacter sp. SD-2]